MRRKIAWLALALTLLALAALPAFAAEHEYDLVLDYAGLLTDDEVAALNDKAWELSDKYNMDICILTAPDTEGKGWVAYTDDFYDENGYGRGPNYDGVMLGMYMQERKLHISTSGYGITAFTDYGIEAIFDEFQPCLSDGEYYKGFDLYLDLAETFIHEAQTNQPYDTNHEFGGVPLSATQKIGTGAGVGGLAGLLASLIGVGRMKSGMHTARPKRNASQYVRKGSMHVTRMQDIFLYRTVRRERIQTSSGGGGGGSSTHVSSSGRTHGGGSRSF